MTDGKYRVVEIFHALQGEGVRAGTVNTFIRLSGCNLRCTADGPAGFDCDTPFIEGEDMTLDEIMSAMEAAVPHGATLPDWVILTGGEPGLQVDMAMLDYLHAAGLFIAIETNGTYLLPRTREGLTKSVSDLTRTDFDLDWITVSPKSSEHTIRQRWADEVKYVRNADQSIPVTPVDAAYKVLSPAFAAMSVDGRYPIDAAAVRRCVQLCDEHPEWRMSLQVHKLIPGGMR